MLVHDVLSDKVTNGVGFHQVSILRSRYFVVLVSPAMIKHDFEGRRVRIIPNRRNHLGCHWCPVHRTLTECPGQRYPEFSGKPGRKLATG